MLLSRTAVVLVALLGIAAGCGDGDAAPDDTADTSGASAPSSPTGSPTSEATDPTPSGTGPVAGAGASVPPMPVEQWCGAVTADQVAALAGIEVEEVSARSDAEGGTRCVAEAPFELDLSWSTTPTTQTLDALRTEIEDGDAFDAYEIREVELGDGLPAITAVVDGEVRAAETTVVVDGRRIQAGANGLLADDAVTADDLAVMTEALVDVYLTQG